MNRSLFFDPETGAVGGGAAATGETGGGQQVTSGGASLPPDVVSIPRSQYDQLTGTLNQYKPYEPVFQRAQKAGLDFSKFDDHTWGLLETISKPNSPLGAKDLHEFVKEHLGLYEQRNGQQNGGQQGNLSMADVQRLVEEQLSGYTKKQQEEVLNREYQKLLEQDDHAYRSLEKELEIPDDPGDDPVATLKKWALAAALAGGGQFEEGHQFAGRYRPLDESGRAKAVETLKKAFEMLSAQSQMDLAKKVSGKGGSTAGSSKTSDTKPPAASDLSDSQKEEAELTEFFARRQKNRAGAAVG